MNVKKIIVYVQKFEYDHFFSVAIVSLAIIIVLTSVVLGVVFGLLPNSPATPATTPTTTPSTTPITTLTSMVTTMTATPITPTTTITPRGKIIDYITMNFLNTCCSKRLHKKRVS